MQQYEIFIVDDQDSNVETLTAMLERGDYAVRSATSGEEALQKIRQSMPDLILMDVLMPGMSGYEVCSALKDDPSTSDIPIIFLSALNDSRDRVRAFEVGGVDYIAKPYSIREVFARVATHLRLFQQQVEIKALREIDQKRIEELQYEIQGRWAAEEQLQNALERISRLNRLLSATNSISGLEDVMAVTCRELSNAYEHSQACITVFHKDRMLIMHQEGATESHFLNAEAIHLDQNPIATKATQGRVFTLRGNLSSEMQAALAELVGQPTTPYDVVIPLIHADNLLGIAFAGKPKTPTATGPLSDSGTEIGQAMAQTLVNSLLYTEITSQNKMLEQLVSDRTSQLDRLTRRMAAILASVTDAIILLNVDGTINTTNKGFETLFGYLPDEQFGVHITQLGDPDYHQDISESLQTAIEHNQSPIIETVVLRKDGTAIDVDMAMKRIESDRSVDDDYIVCVCHDITNLKSTQRMKDNFISMVTHELRTPLTTMNLMATALVNYYDRLDDEKRLDKLTKLKNQGQIMIELVESVLNISRLEARQLDQKFVAINLLEIAEKAIVEQRLAAEQKEHQLYIEESCPQAMVAGTSADIQRIWRNLISNAIKYTPAGGHIEVSVQCIDVTPDAPIEDSLLHHLSPDLPHGTYAIGQVKDDGHGMSVEDQQKLFTRFHRGWAAQSSLPGTGLAYHWLKNY